MRTIGAHVSAAGGPHKAVERAAGIGCNCVQIFSGSPRSWNRKALEDTTVTTLESARKQHGIGQVITHSLYLINLASEDPGLLENSTKALEYDMAFDSAIRGSGIVVHLGSHLGRGWESVKDEVCERIAGILERSPGDATFLIENSAGQSGKLSSDLSEIRWLLDRLAAPQVGWCFDTCHAFAAGLSLADPGSGAAERYAVSEIESLGLWEELKCIHVNDSRDPFGSGRDRHANIGDGEIPADDMRSFLARPEIQDLPLILEVPGIENNGPDAENVTRLRYLVEVES